VSGALPAHFSLPAARTTRSRSRAVRAGRPLQLSGPAVVILVARAPPAPRCFASGRGRAIEAGADRRPPSSAGVDSLCLTTLYGFHSLQLVSRARPCRPLRRRGARRAFSIGEAAAFALLEPSRREPGRECGAAARGGENRATRTTCPPPHPQGRGGTRRHAAGAAGRRTRPTGQSNTSTFTATGTPSNDDARGARPWTGVLRQFDPRQLDQGARPVTRLGAARRARGGDLRASRAAARSDAGGRHNHHRSRTRRLSVHYLRDKPLPRPLAAASLSNSLRLRAGLQTASLIFGRARVRAMGGPLAGVRERPSGSLGPGHR